MPCLCSVALSSRGYAVSVPTVAARPGITGECAQPLQPGRKRIDRFRLSAHDVSPRAWRSRLPHSRKPMPIFSSFCERLRLGRSPSYSRNRLQHLARQRRDPTPGGKLAANTAVPSLTYQPKTRAADCRDSQTGRSTSVVRRGGPFVGAARKPGGARLLRVRVSWCCHG